MKLAFRKQLSRIRFFSQNLFKRYHLNRYVSPKHQSDITTVLMYHGIGNNEYHDLEVSLSSFKNEIMFYLKQGYKVIPLDNICKTTQSAKLVIIFDDGNDNIRPALDWLIHKNLPFNIAISLNIVKNNDFYWFEKLYYRIAKYHTNECINQLKSRYRNAINEINCDNNAKKKYVEQYGDFLSTPKINYDDSHPTIHNNIAPAELMRYVDTGYCTLSAHGVNHDSMKSLSAEEFEKDISTTKNYIESEFGITCSSYVCPFGIYEDSYESILIKSGFLYTFLIKEKINHKSNNFLFHRVKGYGLSIDNYGYFAYIWNQIHRNIK